MSILFKPSSLKGLELANRFVRSATWAGLAGPDGSCTEGEIRIMARLARSRIGLLITGHTYVSPEGQAHPGQLGIYKDELIPGLKRLTEAVHQAGGKVLCQISHAGLWADAALTGLEPLAPTAGPPDELPYARPPRGRPPRQMGRADIERLVEAFGRAAERVQAAGFDGLELHGAHGYLLNQFFSPAFNHRRDEYGGAVDNRARLGVEVVRRIRRGVGPDFPILIKLGCQDFLPGGQTLEDSIQIAARLKEAGLDALELSGGTGASGRLGSGRLGINSPEKEAYFREEARAFRARLDLPLILVGGIRSFEVAESLVLDGTADYLSMCRPFIREPELIKRWQEGDRCPATCLSDSKCFDPVWAQRGLYCVVDQRQAQKKDRAS